MGDNLCEEGLGEVGSIVEEVIRMAADIMPPDGQREEDGSLDGWRVAAREMEVLLEFDMDKGE